VPLEIFFECGSIVVTQILCRKNQCHGLMSASPQEFVDHSLLLVELAKIPFLEFTPSRGIMIEPLPQLGARR
jgi:hypothetical protein